MCKQATESSRIIDSHTSKEARSLPYPPSIQWLNFLTGFLGLHFHSFVNLIRFMDAPGFPLMVSRKHCELQFDKKINAWTIRDCSTYGILVNKIRVKEATLK